MSSTTASGRGWLGGSHKPTAQQQQQQSSPKTAHGTSTTSTTTSTTTITTTTVTAENAASNISAAETTTKSSVAALMSLFDSSSSPSTKASGKIQSPFAKTKSFGNPSSMEANTSSAIGTIPLATIASSGSSSSATTPNNSSRSFDPKWKSLLMECGFIEFDAEFYAHIFTEEDVQTTQISDLTDEFLQKLGISKGGHRLRILAHRKGRTADGSLVSLDDLLEGLSELQDIVEQFNQRISQLETRINSNGLTNSDEIVNTNTTPAPEREEVEVVLTKARSAEAFSPPPKASWISSIALPTQKSPDTTVAASSQHEASSSQSPTIQPQHQQPQQQQQQQQQTVVQAMSPPPERELLSPRVALHASDSNAEAFKLSDLQNPLKERTLIELLLQHYAITLSVMETAAPNEMDSLASSLVSVFETQRALTNLLLASIDREVKVANTEKTLFRANTVHSKVLSAHAKIVGHIYLRQTLGVYVNLMIAESVPLEVDPARLKPTESLNENQKNLQEITKKFVQGLQRSIDLVPLAFRDICHQLKEKVSSKFPDVNPLVSVGSFFFLRYACPAVINPTSFGLSSVTPNPICQRGLLLVAKILQNLSNGTKFNEPYMQFMNEYLQGLQPAITNFCEQLASLPTGESRDNANHFTIPKEQVEQSVSTIYKIVHENFEKISASLIKDNMNNLRDQVADLM